MPDTGAEAVANKTEVFRRRRLTGQTTGGLEVGARGRGLGGAVLLALGDEVR